MKLEFNLKIFIFQDVVYKLIFIFQLTHYIKTDCNITHPVLKNNNCYSIYCSPQEYNTSVCTINNSIAKIQWLTNIIQISEINFRFIHPFLTKNKDFIIQTTSVLGTEKRIFFGLTKFKLGQIARKKVSSISMLGIINVEGMENDLKNIIKLGNELKQKWYLENYVQKESFNDNKFINLGLFDYYHNLDAVYNK